MKTKALMVRSPKEHRTVNLQPPRYLGALLPCCLLALASPAFAGAPGAVGDLYVTTWYGDSVVQLDGQTGAYVGQFVPPGSGGLDRAWGLAWGPNGNLFVVSEGRYDNMGVIEYDGDTGAFVRWVVGPADSDSPETGWLQRPAHLAFAPGGTLYVTGQWNTNVQRYDAGTGEWLGTFAIGGLSPGGLRFPQDLTLGPDGNLFVISGYQAAYPTTGEGRGIMEYHAATGRLVRVFAAENVPLLTDQPNPEAEMFCPFGSALLFRPNGNLLLTSSDVDLVHGNTFRNEVLEFDGATGDLLGPFVQDGSGLNWGTGSLLVCSLNGYQVLEYDGQTGALVGTFANNVQSPMDLAFKPAPVAPLPAPTISGVSVTQLDACDPLTGVVVTGTNLNAGATVMLKNPAEPLGTGGLASTYAGVVTGASGDGTSLTVDFDLDGGVIPSGLWDVVVQNPDGQSATLAAALDITACYSATDGNLFVLGSRHRQKTRDGLFEFDGATGKLIGFPIEDPTLDGEDLRNASSLLFGYGGSVLIISHAPWPGSVLEYDAITGRKLGTLIAEGSGGMVIPLKIAHGPNGNLLVLHRTSGTNVVSGVLEFDGLSGAFVRESIPLGSCGLGTATDFNVAADGAICIAAAHSLFRFDGQTGLCIDGGPLGLAPPQSDLTLGSFAFLPHDGSLVVPWRTDFTGLGRVTLHDSATAALLDVPILPPAGGILQAVAADFGPDGHLFVAGEVDYNHVIVAYDLFTRDALGIFATQENESGEAGIAEFLFKPMLGDRDGDWDRDLVDFAALQRAFGGEGVTPANYNDLTFDFDRDGDVDADDFPGFAQRMTPPKDWSAPPGACCLPDGSCVESTTARECVLDLGGSWLGYGNTCAEECPVFGACCDPVHGTCALHTAEQCDYAGGDYQGDGADCSTAGCPPPGACCSPDDNSCQELSESACFGEGGMYQGDYTECATTTCPFGRYSNEINPITTAALAGNGLQLADDLTLEGDGARDLVYLDLAVYGGGGGPFDVTVSLYDACPGAGGTIIPGTTFTWTAVPDDGYAYTLTADLSAAPVTIPDTVWMVATFSTTQSGWIIAEEAETGTTQNRFYSATTGSCNTTITNHYAGLWANLTCQTGASKARSAGSESLLSMDRIETPVSIEAVE